MNILLFLFEETNIKLLIFESVCLVFFLFFFPTFHHRVFGLSPSLCLLSQVSTRTNSKASYSFQWNQLGYSHIYWTLAKAFPFLVSIKSNLIIKVILFWKKARVLKFTVLHCNSCFPCLQHCVGGGKKLRHSEQNVKSREIFRQQ